MPLSLVDNTGWFAHRCMKGAIKPSWWSTRRNGERQNIKSMREIFFCSLAAVNVWRHKHAHMNNNPVFWDLGPIQTENRCVLQRVKNNKSSNGRAKCRYASITMWPRGSPCLSAHIHPLNLYGGSVCVCVGGHADDSYSFLHCPRTFFSPPYKMVQSQTC